MASDAVPGFGPPLQDSKALLLADDDRELAEIMSKRFVSLPASSTLKDASELFARYLLRALPVLDAQGNILERAEEIAAASPRSERVIRHLSRPAHQCE